MRTIDRLESEVRGYVRSFPTVFTKGEGAHLFDEQGRKYIDFFAGAGALNYGHNNPVLREPLMDYLMEGGVTHGLDMATTAKIDLLETFDRLILRPRGMNYKVQFPGPTGTNAVEAALKLARKVTGRKHVISFTNGFHGMTLGSLAVTGNSFKRDGAGVPLSHATPMPFEGFIGNNLDSLAYLETFITEGSSGIDTPAAIIVETIQAEGGVNVASAEWMRRLATIAKKHDILLIVDDIQVGCGRTGPFFSFERMGIQPDIICLSKSISGYGMPMALVLIKPEHDVWEPGEHNGTFRGHNLAFVTATAAIKTYWGNATDSIEVDTLRKGELVRERLTAITRSAAGAEGVVRGRGMIWGVEFRDRSLAEKIARAAFERGLIIETAGSEDHVLKLLPSLTIDEATLKAGLDIIAECVKAVLKPQSSRTSTASLAAS